MADFGGGTVKWVIDADSSKFDQQLGSSSIKAQTFGKSLNSIDFSGLATSASAAFGGIANGIENTVKKLALLTAGGGSIGAVFLKSAGDLQQTSQSFKVLIGNVDTANQLFGQLLQYANATPFEFPQIAKAAQTLLGFGVQAKDIQRILGQVGDVAGATGGDFDALALVTGQIFAQGKVQAQDFYQIINSRAGALGPLIAKNLGVNGVGALRAEFEKGNVSSAAFFSALQQATEQGGFAFQGTNQLAQTLNGRLSTLKDAALEFGRNLLGVKVDPELGLTIKPGGVFDRLSLLVPRITASLQELAPRIVSAFDFIIRNGGTVKALLAGLAAAFVSAKVAAIGFSIAASLNPITLIATAVVALIAGLTFLQVKFAVFTQILQALQPVIDPIVNAFGFLFHLLAEQLSPIIDFVSRNLTVFKDIVLVLIAVALAPLAVAISSVVAGIGLAVAVTTGAIFVFDHLAAVVVNVGKFFVSVFGGIFSGAIGMIGNVVSLFASLPRRILDALGNLGSVLLNAGRSIIDGFINGIKDKFNDVKDTLGSLTKKLTSWKGPESLDKKILVGNGQLVIGGFINGLESQYGAVKSSLQGLTSNIGASAPQFAPDVASATTLSASQQAANSVIVNVSMDGIMTRSRSDLRDIAKDMISSVNEELRSRRLPELGGGAI